MIIHRLVEKLGRHYHGIRGLGLGKIAIILPQIKMVFEGLMGLQNQLGEEERCAVTGMRALHGTKRSIKSAQLHLGRP